MSTTFETPDQNIIHLQKGEYLNNNTDNSLTSRRVPTEEKGWKFEDDNQQNPVEIN